CLNNGYICQSQYYSGSSSTGTLLKTTATQFHNDYNPYDQYTGQSTFINVFPTSETVTWPGGKTSQSTTSYDSGFTYYIYNPINDSGDPHTAFYAAPLLQKFYDYGQGSPGPLLKQVSTNYVWQTDSNYVTANMFNLPATSKILDGSGNV